MNNSIAESANKNFDTSGSQACDDPVFVISKESLVDDKSCIVQLFRILAASNQFESLYDAIRLMLEIGRLRFNADLALVSKSISNQVFEVHAHAGEGDFFTGQHLTIDDNLCRRVRETAQTVEEQNLGAFNINPVAYNQENFQGYLGTYVKFSAGASGVLAFFWREGRNSSLSDQDNQILELMAEGIACMASLQNTRARRNRGDLAVFASGSLQSLEEYEAMATLGEQPGIAGKVTESLKRRVGNASLNIDAIAEELRLSKRTLQRRLQQQESSFAELRDRVRFHFAIDLLVRQQLSVDKISTVLDFSDRTSFTNAFKRWTSLSPSTFRKVFRDYT